MTPPSLIELRPEYARLWDTTVIRPEKLKAVDAAISKLVLGRARYGIASEKSGVPWAFIAVVHHLEGSGNWSTHLHNGDSLKARTVHVPKGRPVTGSPPFTWEDSAADALAQKGLGKSTDWTIPGTLFQLERYNGWGYRHYHPKTLTPYLWSYSTHYGPPESPGGKYVADGVWNSRAVSDQIGAAVLLKRLHEQKLITFESF